MSRTLNLFQISIFLRSVFLFSLIVGALISSVAASKPDLITGEPRVIDGDTIEVSGQKIRLHGIDAPESRQTCQKGGVEWLCGQEASNAMRAIVGRSNVACEATDIDRYGRVVGRCVAEGYDIGKALVSQGLALAYRRYSKDYVDVEAGAKASRLGMWSGQFISPWDWRRGKRLVTGPANDNEACQIKGNISQSGERIYHIPNGYHYLSTEISPDKGERYFCSEDEAMAAGWHRSRN